MKIWNPELKAVFTSLMVAAVVLMAITIGCTREPDAPDQPNATGRNTDTPDSTAAPGDDANEPLTAVAAALRSNQIRTRHLFDGSVTYGKIAVKATTVTVLAGQPSVTTAADPDIALGFLLSCDPAGNQDQHMDNAVLNADGGITITLAANATANNIFRCVSLKPNAKGVT